MNSPCPRRASGPPRTSPPPRESSLDDSLASRILSQPFLGVRRLTRIAMQLLAELDRAHREQLALADLTPYTVQLLQPETAFEQATVRGQHGRPWSETQQQDGMTRVAALMEVLLAQRLYLEESIADQGRFGGAPYPRRRDIPFLQSVAQALRMIADRCRAGTGSYDSAAEGAQDLNRLLVVIQRTIARRRPPLPKTSLSGPAPRRPLSAPLPLVVVAVAPQAHPAHLDSDKRVDTAHPAAAVGPIAPSNRSGSTLAA